MKIIELAEAFNAALPYKVKKYDDGYTARFKTESSSLVEVSYTMFHMSDIGFACEVSFSVNGSLELTGANEAVAVFATVKAASIEILKKLKYSPCLLIAASTTEQRMRVYGKIIRNVLRELPEYQVATAEQMIDKAQKQISLMDFGSTNELPIFAAKSFLVKS